MACVMFAEIEQWRRDEQTSAYSIRLTRFWRNQAVRPSVQMMEHGMGRFTTFARWRRALPIRTAGSTEHAKVTRGPAHWFKRERLLVKLIDDRVLVRESMAAALQACALDITVEQLSCGETLNDPDAAVRGAQVILINIGRSKLAADPVSHAVEELLRQAPHPPMAVIADWINSALVNKGRRLGLSAVISADEGVNTVVAAIRGMSSGGTYI
ncbi:MAG TPA: hypothetical protein VD978_08565 [Azospirillum sp.]|nr:hypothetical protein [Azospirillum sp.]